MTSVDYLPRASKGRFWLLSLLVLCVDVSAGATVQLGQSLSQQANLTSSTIALNTTKGHYHCSRQADFMTDTFDGKDCLAAIEKLRRIEEAAHNTRLYEFYEPPHHHEHPYPTQEMPRKYVSGKCPMKET